jgi:hypothetical protein
MKKFLMSLLLVAALAGSAMAATYTTKDFSVNFVGEVAVNGPANNTENTSITTFYSSSNETELDMVSVRFVNHDIPADTTSSDFYATETLARICPTNVATCRMLLEFESRSTYQGHPYTYVVTEITDTETSVVFWVRTRYIIVNSREATFIDRMTTKANSDQESSGAFLNSLDIK